MHLFRNDNGECFSEPFEKLFSLLLLLLRTVYIFDTEINNNEVILLIDVQELISWRTKGYSDVLFSCFL